MPCLSSRLPYPSAQYHIFVPCHPLPQLPCSSLSKLRGAMHDWAPAIIATALFALLSPGGILQLPGRQRTVDFMNLRTSCLSILVHAVIYAVLLMLFVVILQAHLYV
ncbi:uncharacterized protein LOC119272309 [Triticum dicoccoides]|uniref:uncharacterized protein LOC119272309 n=1 Tax=Triticum dicoccoides TaxID=85692 RepID=UPI000E7AD004|nr:uncharacterized protein LOC119272309 [Triticum dicoccoides]